MRAIKNRFVYSAFTESEAGEAENVICVRED
jgi:hypothetical protein